MFDKRALDDIRKAQEKWEAENKAAFEKETQDFVNAEGIPIKRLYTPLDLEAKGFDYLKDLSFPGQYPFTRGNEPTMFRSELWKMGPISGYASIEESKEVWKRLIAQGATSLWVFQDLPTQMGYDPDHPLAIGEVGETGPSISSLKDIEKFFEGIDIGAIPIHIQANTQSAVAISQWAAVGKQRGLDVSRLYGSTQNDMLKEFACRNTYRFPLRPSIRLTTDIITYSARYFPNFSPVQPQTVCYEEKHANMVRQVAYCLGNTIAYMESVVKRGVDIDLVAPKISFSLSYSHEEFWEEIARVRAMRRIYARIMKERFKAKDPRSCAMRQLCYVPLGVTLYRQQPMNNIPRITLGLLAAVLAGTESIQSRCWTEGWGIPIEEVTLFSLRMQQVLAYETGIANTVDPLAGSYYLECLTSEFEEMVLKELDEIEAKGGMVKAIEEGHVQKQLLEDVYKWLKAVEKGGRDVVGVNKFCTEEPGLEIPVYQRDPEFEERRIAEVEELRRSRNNSQVHKALDNLRRMAEKEESEENNLMPSIMEAVESYATNGEICGGLVDVWGEYKQPSIL